MKNLILRFSFILAALIIISCGLLHYYKIADIPYGFHVDEMSGAVTMGCLATEGTDAHRIKYPVFANLNYGTPKPPIYLYPGLLWVKAFGYSVESLRILSVTVHLIGVVGIFFLARVFFGGSFALVTLLVASISPWAWVPSRVAFESLFAPTFLIWGLYFLLKSNALWRVAIAGVFLACAMYSYPPTRLQIPFLLITLLFYARYKGLLNFKSALVFILSFALPLIPLVIKTLSGEVQGRFNSISIFSKPFLESIGSSGSVKDLVGIFFHNYALHFTPNFLFQTGDPSAVHSTLRSGILSWLDMAALGIFCVLLLALLFKRFRASNPLNLEKAFIIFVIANILIGVAPVALTNSELPNSLRIIGAWPFMCLLTGFLLWKLCEWSWVFWLALVLSAALFSASYLKVYFKVYPKESKGMFNFWTLEEANSLKSEEDWLKFMVRYRYDDYHVRYFLMQYRHIGCSDSKTRWDAVRQFLQSRGEY